MKDITANTYALFYAGSNIGHAVYYNGMRVVAFTTAANYYRITFYNGIERNIRAVDTLQVSNKQYFIKK